MSDERTSVKVTDDEAPSPKVPANWRTWLSGILILAMPFFLVYFLGSQMAIGQVQSKARAVAEMPEITSLSQLATTSVGALADGQIVMVSGVVASASPLVYSVVPAVAESPGQMLIYQERPLDGREVRFQETFPLHFSDLAVALTDGQLFAQATDSDERVIAYEPQQVEIGDREMTGFLLGDAVTLQGTLMLDGDAPPYLTDISGISGIDKSALEAELAVKLAQVRRVRNLLGLVTLLSIGLLLFRWIQTRGGWHRSPQSPMAEQTLLAS